MWSHPEDTVNLVTFTEEILDAKLHFLCSPVWMIKSWLYLSFRKLMNAGALNECKEAATRGVLWKKVILEISQNSQENTCARVSFLIKLQAWGLQLIKKETLA